MRVHFLPHLSERLFPEGCAPKGNNSAVSLPFKRQTILMLISSPLRKEQVSTEIDSCTSYVSNCAIHLFSPIQQAWLPSLWYN